MVGEGERGGRNSHSDITFADTLCIYTSPPLRNVLCHYLPATCGHGTCNAKKVLGDDNKYDDYDKNKPLRDPFVIETHKDGCKEFDIVDEDDWSIEQYNFLIKSCAAGMRHLMWEVFCVSSGRQTPLYTTYGMYCPESCGTFQPP